MKPLIRDIAGGLLFAATMLGPVVLGGVLGP